MAGAIMLILFLALIPLILLLGNERRSSKKLPPGSLGIPIIGQSLGLLRAMRNNTAEKWLQKRLEKYGPISKMSLFGTPTIFLTGPAANKFLVSTETLTLQQPQSIASLIGKRNMMELRPDDHKRVRGAVILFLRPEILRKFVGKIDGEIRNHLKMNWINRQEVTVLPLMKSLTFDIICSTMFGVEKGALREILVKDFNNMLAGMWVVPVNLPCTHFHNRLKASRRVRGVLTGVLQEKKVALERGALSPHHDLITYLISLGQEDGVNSLTEEEIVDNAMLVMIAGHDTSSILITFIIRHLASDQATYATVLQEQEEIAQSKAHGEPLPWDDLMKMKYTWRVAMELLRTIAPLFGGFRKVLKDIEFGGYLIPKGWQVFWATSVTHMDANILKDPQKFDPMRFTSLIPPYCFVPFGTGPRICPGNEFAKMETLVALHYIVTRFKWRLCCKDDVFCRDPLPSPSQGLPVLIEPNNVVPS